MNATRGCRKMSFRESQQKRGRGKKRSLGNGTGIVASVVGQRNDDQYMNVVTKVFKKPCKLCQEPGHRGYARCPKVMKYSQPYGTSPFPPNCASSRGELCQKLGKDNGFVSSYLDVNDGRVILKSMPQKMKALILHKRLIRKGVEDKGLGSRSIIMQVTFLAEGGDPHVQYDGVLFELNVITKWIHRSKNNIIVSQLEDVICKENTPSPTQKKHASIHSSKNMEPLREIDCNSLDYNH
eukprot:scaffold72682_cov71-Attheya_sp.AAC.3